MPYAVLLFGIFCPNVIMTTAPQYIEIVGLPGAGKTTAAKFMVHCLQKVGRDATQRVPLRISLFQRIRILFKVGILILKTPGLCRFLVYPILPKYRHVRHARSVVWNMRVRFCIEVIIVQGLLAQNKAILVNDEGVIGKLVPLSVVSGIPEVVTEALLHRLLPKNARVVCVHTEPDAAIARTLQRRTFLPFFHDMDSTTQVEFSKKNLEMYQRVCARLACTTTITNAQTSVDLEKEVARAVSGMVM